MKYALAVEGEYYLQADGKLCSNLGAAMTFDSYRDAEAAAGRSGYQCEVVVVSGLVDAWVAARSEYEEACNRARKLNVLIVELERRILKGER